MTSLDLGSFNFFRIKQQTSMYVIFFVCLTTNLLQTECYGNGYCGICETCICYTDRDGSQYFNPEDNCQGLCNKVATECDDCLINNTIGECSKCNYITMQLYNESLTKETTEYGLKIWVKCSETIDDCGQLEYYASRDEAGEVYIMMLNHCNAIVPVAIVADTKGKNLNRSSRLIKG